MATRWKEEASRALALVAMGDFPTAADAFFELVDNPIDYRRGRKLHIDLRIDRGHDLISITDWGGEGMDAKGIADWLNWGSGHPHTERDIGQYHKGGKAACGYLANSVRIFARRAGQREVWRFEDLGWKLRNDWTDFGEPLPYVGALPSAVAGLPEDVGFTHIELFNLADDRRYEVERLKWRLANTYRKLLQDQVLQIAVDGKTLQPIHLPLSSALERIDLQLPLSSGRRIRGWVGRLDRDALQSSINRVPGGIRCLFQGRLVREGEFFGYHAEGKGLLAALIGEIELSHLKPLSNKTDFNRGTKDWVEVETAVNDWLRPIIAEFRRAGETHAISREARKRLNQVRRQLSEAMRELATGGRLGNNPTAAPSADGRKPPSGIVQDHFIEAHRPRHTRSEGQPRTPAPPDAVGTLVRLGRRLDSGKEMPPFELQPLDPSVRSDSKREGGLLTKVVINSNYCLYRELDGKEAYLAETALIELLKPAEGDKRFVPEFLGDLEQALIAWHRVASKHDSAA